MLRISRIDNFRTILFVIALNVVFFSSCTKGKRTVISGKLENPVATTLYLSEFNLVSAKVIDSVQPNSNGKFKFVVTISEPNFYQLSSTPNDFALLLVSPGEKVELKAVAGKLAGSYTVQGSVLSLEVKKLNEKLARTRYSLDSLKKIAYLATSKPGYDKLIANLDSQAFEIIKAQRKYSIKYIIENLTSMASIVPLYQQIDNVNYVLNQNRDLQYVKLLSDSLLKHYPESKIVKTLYADRERLLSDFNRLKLLQKASETKASLYPDIALKSIGGDTIRLSSVKSKYILLNFWDPFNEDCLYVLRGLKEIHAKYKSKGFEIYNVALYNDVPAWRKMVDKYRFAGIQVIDPLAISSASLRLYNVNTLPATFLIGPEGIMAKDLFGERLDVQLTKLLK